MNLNILFDRSISIRDSVDDVQFTLFLTICHVVMVIFLFLRNLSATVIPSLALPLSIMGTFAVMYVMGFSMNNLTLMALTLSVGFVVDDAIDLSLVICHGALVKRSYQTGLRHYGVELGGVKGEAWAAGNH